MRGGIEIHTTYLDLTIFFTESSFSNPNKELIAETEVRSQMPNVLTKLIPRYSISGRRRGTIIDTDDEI